MWPLSLLCPWAFVSRSRAGPSPICAQSSSGTAAGSRALCHGLWWPGKGVEDEGRTTREDPQDPLRSASPVISVCTPRLCLGRVAHCCFPASSNSFCPPNCHRAVTGHPLLFPPLLPSVLGAPPALQMVWCASLSWRQPMALEKGKSYNGKIRGITGSTEKGHGIEHSHKKQRRTEYLTSSRPFSHAESNSRHLRVEGDVTCWGKTRTNGL